MRSEWQLAAEIWEAFDDVDSRWAGRFASTLATLRPREYIQWSLRRPIFDRTAGPIPFLLAWTFDDEALVIELSGNPILRGAMRLSSHQEDQLRALGFDEPAASPWFPGRDGLWRMQSSFLDVGWLGVIMVAVMTGVMELPHPALAQIVATSELGPEGERPCLHALQCTCHTDVL